MKVSDRIALGHLLKKARLDAGLSRREMALRLQLTDFYSSSPKTINAILYFWETGKCRPRAEILQRYTERFGVAIPNLNSNGKPPKVNAPPATYYRVICRCPYGVPTKVERCTYNTNGVEKRISRRY